MGYRLENKDIDLSGLRQLNFKPTSKAGSVYRYKGSAIRVFDEGEEPIDEETAKYLTDIRTERIILPKKLLFYNNAFRGYTMKLVSQKGAGKKISNAPTDEFINNVRVIEKDIAALSQRRVLLNGATPGYTLYNGELYIVDPSNYRILDSVDVERLQELNQFQLHLLLTELLSSELKKSNVPNSSIQHLKELLGLRDIDQPSSSYFGEIMKGQRNLKELVKKIG